MANEKDNTNDDITLNFLRINWFSSLMILIGTTLIGFSKVADAVDDITHYFHWGDHYDVDESTERGKFSTDLLQTAEYRLFWMEAYCSSVKKRRQSRMKRSSGINTRTRMENGTRIWYLISWDWINIIANPKKERCLRTQFNQNFTKPMS